MVTKASMNKVWILWIELAYIWQGYFGQVDLSLVRYGSRAIYSMHTKCGILMKIVKV